MMKPNRSLGSKLPRKVKPEWQEERIALLTRLCREIDEEMGTGKTLVAASGHAALKAVSERYSNGKLALLSPQTLMRSWQKLKDFDGNPRVLRLNYRYEPPMDGSGGSQLRRDIRELFVELVERGPITSMQQGYRTLVKCWREANGEELPASQTQLYRAFSQAEKLSFKEIFEKRKRYQKGATI